MQPYFSIENLTNLSSIPSGSGVHVIGVCGVAMAPLAVELLRRGFAVSGSDKEFFEPMGSMLRSSGIRLFEGYRAENIPEQTELVIVGNAVSRDHPEVVETERRSIAFSCFPVLLADLILRDRHSIVVAGTHGKSTTTALTSHTLTELGAAPSMFFGAQPVGGGSGLVVRDGKFSVVEGDEYDSAFFAKVPKFTFYLPKSVILTSIEFDHADIYRDLAHVEEQFTKLIAGLPEGAYALCCVDCENIRRLLPKWQKESKASLVTYGESADAELRLLERQTSAEGQNVNSNQGSFSIPLYGQHNALNSLAVYGLLLRLGFEKEKVAGGLSKYQGIKRRQEVRFNQNGICLIDDFAHHPTAVRETLKGLREAHPNARIWAVFEARSNTSRRRVFQKEYATAFKDADLVLLPNVQAKSIDQGLDLLRIDELAESISQTGCSARMLSGAGEIEELLVRDARSGDLVVVMSNGGFDGLVGKLVERFQSASGAR